MIFLSLKYNGFYKRIMITDNNHKEIPGNPSTAKSSIQELRSSASADTLRVLTIDQWSFWMESGYIVSKMQFQENKQ